MPSRMVPLDQVKPGTRINKDVLDPKGALLYKAGTELNAQALERLKMRNVPQVIIEDESGGLSEEELKKLRDQIDRDVDEMFGDLLQQQMMLKVAEAAKRHLKKKLG